MTEQKLSINSKELLIVKQPEQVNELNENQVDSNTSTVCIKVANLRKIGYNDLEEWMDNPKNLYVGRPGRIFITDPKTNEKRIFHYKRSKWANPYPVGAGKGKYSLEESLNLYGEHLEKSGLVNEVSELKGLTLGCFCLEKNPCHAKILADLANKSTNK